MEKPGLPGFLFCGPSHFIGMRLCSWGAQRSRICAQGFGACGWAYLLGAWSLGCGVQGCGARRTGGGIWQQGGIWQLWRPVRARSVSWPVHGRGLVKAVTRRPRSLQSFLRHTRTASQAGQSHSRPAACAAGYPPTGSGAYGRTTSETCRSAAGGHDPIMNGRFGSMRPGGTDLVLPRACLAFTYEKGQNADFRSRARAN